MTENEFLLEDRKQKIRSVVDQYGEDKFYVSFSGGRDSTVLSSLIDQALPDNKIPRVYANTGIEYKLIVEFVQQVKSQEHSWEVVILKPSRNIKQTLEEYGYPFKSKEHAKWVDMFQRNGHTQSIENYTAGERRDKELYRTCPKKLLYQFGDDFQLRVSDKCCFYMKEQPLDKWSKENKRPIGINGLIQDEQGRRKFSKCLAFRGGKLRLFQPLSVITKEWEDWYIKEYNVDICDIYKEPYNLERTGCKGCPFALYLQKELDTLEKFFPEERKQCELIWKPVYDEYRRLGYRLNKDEAKDQLENDQIDGQMSIYDFIGKCG